MTVSKIQRKLLQLERFIARVRKIWENKRHVSGEIYVQDRVNEYKQIWFTIAEKLGATFTILDDELWEIQLGEKKTRVLNYKMEFDNPITLEMAGKKPLVYRLLQRSGLRVPDYAVFRLEDLHRAVAFLERNPQGCVVKPVSGTSSGLGVTTHVLTRRELRKAAILASLYCPDLLIETMIPGESYRLLILNGELIHAVRRAGPRAVGDGASTVAQLIQRENESRRYRGQYLICADRDCLFTLGYQNLSLGSIPPNGQSVLLQSIGNSRRVEVRTVYNEVATHLICDALRRNAEAAADTLGCHFAGVDFITPDPTIPLEQSGGVVNEVNTTPGLHHHYDSAREKYPEPAVRAIGALLDG
jgi:D-alanine-D-alanine ligase-like ATP-grasp enzyme